MRVERPEMYWVIPHFKFLLEKENQLLGALLTLNPIALKDFATQKGSFFWNG
jgi:hypothetical protein